MNELKKILSTEISTIVKIVASNPIYKSNEFFKIVVEKKDSYFQASKYFETKVCHENIKNHYINNILELVSSFKQVNIFTVEKTYSVLINKKGNIKVNLTEEKCVIKENLSHNREKNYIIKEHTKIDFLIYLGVMNRDGKILAAKQKKFKQINKFLEILKDIEDLIENNSTIIDIGCGKSYLTFSIYYYFNIIKNKNVKIIGLDLKKDVVDHCNKISKELKYENLEFLSMDIKDFLYEDRDIDLVVSLHACDTATDYSIYNGIKWGAKVILAVPCCQHEIFAQIKNEDNNELLKHGILKERFSAMITDTMRATLMESCGYNTKIMEFIDMEHTPKNIILKGIYTGKKTEFENYDKLSNMYSSNITLANLLKGEKNGK